jgi:hypothetical protein
MSIQSCAQPIAPPRHRHIGGRYVEVHEGERSCWLVDHARKEYGWMTRGADVQRGLTCRWTSFVRADHDSLNGDLVLYLTATKLIRIARTGVVGTRV